MQASRKVTRWDGPNKRRARARKINLVARAQKCGFLPRHPQALTFAGAKAHFERGLIRRGIIRPEDIITIQTCRNIGNHKTDAILKKLISLRNKELPGMMIWPYDFSSFSEGYEADGVTIPAFVGSPPAWFKSPTFRREMHAFLEHKPRRFDVIDADICGTFSEANGGDIVRLMQNGRLADRGLLFINHMKGRDGRFGKLFQFLREYLHFCPYFDVDSLEDDYGDRVDLKTEDPLSFWFVRYVLVPIYYTCEAFAAGYLLNVERLVEYRDRNPSTRAGVNMLQWYFSFERLASSKLAKGISISRYSKALSADKEALDEALDLIARAAYPYTESID